MQQITKTAYIKEYKKQITNLEQTVIKEIQKAIESEKQLYKAICYNNVNSSFYIDKNIRIAIKNIKKYHTKLQNIKRNNKVIIKKIDEKQKQMEINFMMKKMDEKEINNCESKKNLKKITKKKRQKI